MSFGGAGAVLAMKTGDFTPTSFPMSDTGFVDALAYSGSHGLVWAGPGNVAISSVLTIPDGGTLMFGPGDYSMTGSSGISVGNGSTFAGRGFNATTLTLAASYSATAVVQNTNQAGGAQSCMFRDFAINGNRSIGGVATYGILSKGIGQPTRMSNVVVFLMSGIGIQVEGISANAASLTYMDNCWVNDCSGHGCVVTGPMGAFTSWRCSYETVPAGKAGLYIDGSSGSTDKGGIWIQDTHIEALSSTAIGILIEDSKNVSIDKVLYFGSGANGDLVKITGSTADTYNITCKDLYVRFNATATTINDVTNGVSFTNEVAYYSTAAMRLLGAMTLGSTLDLTGILTARAATANFGTAGTAHTTNVGLGGSGAAQSDLVINSGSSGATQARWLLERNAQADLLGLANGTLEQFQFRHALTFNTTAGAGVAYLSAIGQFRTGDSNPPSNGWLEPAAGTTTKAPIYLGAAGTLLTTPLAGGMEWDATWLYFSTATSKRSIVHLDRKGTNIASATTIAMPTDGDVFHVTGSTNITSGITVNAVDAGRTVVLIFDSTPTVTDTGTSKLNGDFTATADSTLTLKCDGTSWFELARSLNS